MIGEASLEKLGSLNLLFHAVINILYYDTEETSENIFKHSQFSAKKLL